MKFENYVFNKSSFLSIEKDCSIIVDKFLSNDRLKKLLHYTTSDALLQPSVSEKDSINLFKKNIKLVPKLKIDKEILHYIVIMFDKFIPNETNPEFRDNIISFDIICHYDQWQLNDYQLRPYRIAAEIDSMMNNQKLSGIGELKFLGASQIVLTDEFGGITLYYETIHGEEDKTHPYNEYNRVKQYGDV